MLDLGGFSRCYASSNVDKLNKNLELTEQAQEEFLTDKPTLSQRYQAFKERFFPERQIFLRSEGRVSFVKLGSKLQMFTTASLLLFSGWVGVSSYNYLSRDMVMESKDSEIATLKTDYNELDSDYFTLDAEVKSRTETLERRQDYLESLIEGSDAVKPVDLPEDTVSKPKSVEDKSQAMLIERIFGTGKAYADSDLSRHTAKDFALSELRMLEDKQQDLANRLLLISQNKLAEIDGILKDTAVNIDRLITQYEGDTSGMGGPFIPDQGFSPLFSDTDHSVYQSLQKFELRLDIVTTALDSFPIGQPAEKYYVSSRFGGRTDPFTKRKAKHPGLDMAGWPGTAIQAATDGVVITARVRPAYGLMVEIDHGNGFHTRYGHMKKLHVKKGDIVKLGQRIGDMGKTGRATSSHLHYEIWFEGKVHDPLPFIKAAEDVRKIQGRYESS